MHPLKTQISLRSEGSDKFAQSEHNLHCSHEKLCIFSYPKCAQVRFSSDRANVQVNLNHHWVHMSKGSFRTLRFLCCIVSLSQAQFVWQTDKMIPAVVDATIKVLLETDWLSEASRNALITKVIYLSIYLSIYVCLSLCFSVCVCVRACVCIAVYSNRKL